MIYFTSDLHFCHDKEFLYKPRGFNSITEHDETIVENWNKTVGPEDVIYILGDIVLNDVDKGIDYFNLLNGEKFILRGNHDTDNKLKELSARTEAKYIGYADVLKYGKYSFYLSHYPTVCSRIGEKDLKHSLINLCGHTHTKDRFQDIEKGLIYHVELDAHDNKPVSIEEILEDLKTEDNKTRIEKLN